MTIPNVLADRYASAEMREIWSAESKIVLERRFWLAVLRGQAELGVDVPTGALQAYEEVVDTVDLDSIAARERVTRHDVKARIEEFNSLAGHEEIHKGLTSRDLTENVELLQVLDSLRLIRSRTVSTLVRLAARAGELAEVAVTGRTHNVPAQVTTIGKRFANSGEELIAALDRLDSLIARFALRGLKGPVGTQQDLLDLLGSAEAVDRLEAAVASDFGVERVMSSVGQVYPRSFDIDYVSALVQLCSGPANLAKSLRLMAGHELATEGFRPGQVGSSAMPHKMNSRSCERIGGLMTVLAGHLTMAASLAGDQWNEGDVSCSVVRRVVLPDASFAADGLFQTLMTVLDELGIYPAVVARELDRYLPFLATTKILMGAVKAGVGREVAHGAISEHAVAAALSIREGTGTGSQLLELIDADDRIPLGLDELESMIDSPLDFAGRASDQVASFVQEVEKISSSDPEAVSYRPDPIL